MDKDELSKILHAITHEHNFRMEILEKDYYLTVILNNLHDRLSDKLVFKGGTLLNKVHLNYHRLSEDLDFSYYGEEDLTKRSNRSAAIAPIKEKMPGFLSSLDLRSDKPKGEGFNSSKQYVFNAFYPSVITNKEGNIKIEISLRQKPYDRPAYNVVHHFYKDPFTGRNLIPENKILSLSLDEAVAEKLKAAITRKDPVIRDYYDLWHIAEAGFDFHKRHFLELFKKKLKDEDHHGDFKDKFGLSENKLDLLTRQVETDLIPVIRIDEVFDLNKVFSRFNKILGAINY
ncbi:nucleotidyl transferase AbiEii/AbiGii toxin family protein [Candidatus Saganbacteria bacterium]|nr:nucleotidyl transferase AbiEii/AbiGii toxin family protein [Candidatus Saganbacteria bacterium]